MKKDKIPEISVGIQVKNSIEFTLKGKYRIHEINISGSWKASWDKNVICLSNGKENLSFENEILISPLNENEEQFILHAVTIGIGFHWQRDEDQAFKGSLKLIIENGKLRAINVLPLEYYLMSVISSEMSATSSLELLKAHAVISRSWLLAQIYKNEGLQLEGKKYQSTFQTDIELIKWYDREDHTYFDVCADDHCQRYQGITRSTTKFVEEAVKSTWGEVLEFEGQICDARFSKCCGGKVEVFENVWEPINHPYLQSFEDSDINDAKTDLRTELKASAWILGEPDVFCNTSDKTILSQVLNDYDQETNDFFRWTVIYTQEEISELINRKTGVDFGSICDLIPLERGDSGRLIKLKIVGANKTMIIGKELEIRKVLSESHLYSSAFVVNKNEDGDGVIFELKGAGWGHGVGLCQIGASVMGAKGYKYHEILKHYFRGAGLNKRY